MSLATSPPLKNEDLFIFIQLDSPAALRWVKKMRLRIDDRKDLNPTLPPQQLRNIISSMKYSLQQRHITNTSLC